VKGRDPARCLQEREAAGESGLIPRYAACRVLRRRGVPVRACVALGMMARRRHQSCARPSFFCLCA